MIPEPKRVPARRQVSAAYPERHGRLGWAAAVRVALVLLLVPAGCEPPKPEAKAWSTLPHLPDLDGKVVGWNPPSGTRAVVFVFAGVECPISNRVQPELEALEAELSSRRIAFYEIYPYPDETAEGIRKHRLEYRRSAMAFLDKEHVLAKALGAHRTPEAVAMAADGRKIYQGRINDQYRALGVAKPEPTRHDLAEALRGFLAGEEPSGTTVPAVGCSFRALP
jgi:hypothetical protein